MPSANYVLLEKITVGAAGASTVTFNSIPQSGYTDIVVKFSARDAVAGNPAFYIAFNGSTTLSSGIRLTGNGTSAASTAIPSSPTTGYGGTSGGNDTASTFTNGEIYIPNYTSSNYKSYSVDNVGENNATSALAALVANLWSSTAAITSVTLSNSGGTFQQYSTFSLYGVAALGTTPAIAPKATGGDIIQTDGTYWYHAFLSSGTFTPATGLTCDYLVVAGGGSGGGQVVGSVGAGGGGAGGYLTSIGGSPLSLSAAGYTVTIGAGGTGVSGNLGNNGSNSVFSSITATGGGKASTLGGSGGGGVYNGSGGAGTSGQGNAGGNGAPGGLGKYGGGGGGGAGAVGSVGSTTAGGNGGIGLLSAIGSAINLGSGGYFAGGGGGSVYGLSGATIAGIGGTGGGGSAPSTTNTAGGNGTANTGGGGGASVSANPGVSTAGGNGGSGIVIVRYTIA